MKTDIIEVLEQFNYGNYSINQAANEVLDLFSVSVPFPSDELIEERGKDFESKTYYNLEEGEKIGDFEVGAKWAIDYLQGNER